jgi:hypothetical protein
MDGGARQKHGLNFEEWIKKTFFQSYTQTGYTDKWDSLSVTFKNDYASYTSSFNGLPVSMKTCGYGSSIGFGDALRQIENNEDFLLIAGFWQSAGNGKKIVSIGAVKIDAADWQNLFVTSEEGKTETYEDFLGLDTVQKIRQLDRGIKREQIPFYKDARDFAKKSKMTLPTGLSMSINPKIDSKTQRRVQCSLPFSVFESLFKSQFAFQSGKATFWGETVPLLD